MSAGQRSRWTRPLGAALAAACIALSACGFRLEGRTPLPAALRVACVESANDQTDFVEGLRRALVVSGSRLTDRSAQATAVVHILEDRVTPRVVAVSATNLPREYEITYTVRVSVTSGGRSLLAPEDLSVTRDFAFDEHVVLAKDREESILRAALASDLVDIVMRRLASL